MASTIQMTMKTKRRPEEMLRDLFGKGAEEWLFAPYGLRAEGIRFTDDPKDAPISWGGTEMKKRTLPSGEIVETPPWRGEVHRLYAIEAVGFWDRSRMTEKNLFFWARKERPHAVGALVIAIFDHFEHPSDKLRFGLVTVADERVAELCHGKGRAPLFISPGADPRRAIEELTGAGLVAA